MDQVHPGTVADAGRLRRGVDATALWQLGVLAVVWAGGAGVLWLASSLFRLDARIVIGVWTLGGVALFVPPIEVALSWVLLGLRRPTPDQREMFGAAWARVCATAGVRPDRFVLRVQRRGALNAEAGAGHIVGVTTTALTLPPRYLEAVLAHELGHHVGGHAMVGMLHAWYSFPLRTLVRCLLWIGRLGGIAMALTRPVPFASLVLLPLVLLSCAGTLLLPLVALPVTASIIVMRRSELRADGTAVRLGYGAELYDLYRRWASTEPPPPGPWKSVKAFLRNTHPRFDTRVANIERLLTAGTT